MYSGFLGVSAGDQPGCHLPSEKRSAPSAPIYLPHHWDVANTPFRAWDGDWTSRTAEPQTKRTLRRPLGKGQATWRRHSGQEPWLSTPVALPTLSQSLSSRQPAGHSQGHWESSRKQDQKCLFNFTSSWELTWSSAIGMSFSWVPAMHTRLHTHTCAHACSSLRGKNAAFSLLSIITMISDSLHSCFLRSAASRAGLSQRTRTSSAIHSAGPALYSPGQKEKTVPRKVMSAVRT